MNLQKNHALDKYLVRSTQQHDADSHSFESRLDPFHGFVQVCKSSMI